ncbi:MAG: hypothetical protein CO170_02740 [candidate division SR1 bacterium CG_4_9_14_3_um_filter_40_9]|nr:MAG: hypothetical protein CO170_02740 [candidate division SR1 bacterium CG_4_9_14_3_um_filter_40_9]
MNFQQKNLYHNPNNIVMGSTFHSTPHKPSGPLKKKIVYGLLITVGFFCIVGGFRFTKNVLQDLPDVSKIKDMVFSQATIITDKNGEELYKLFEENRQYIDFSGISTNMVNAIIAIEDQRYREHNGLDPMGLVRAGITKLINPGSRMGGASTIPQQLVKNLLLTNERKVSRKLKEIILTSRLSDVLESQIHQEMGGLNATELRKEMKDRTLELYLNYISFGNNAFGVEAASKTYFGKSAIDLTVLESSILASLPKGPSLYDPYKNPELLMGEFAITDVYGNPVAFSGDVRTSIINKMTSVLQAADLSDKKSDNSFIKFLNGIGSFSLNIGGINVKVQYTNGRKDLVLTRMYEDSYITQDDLKAAFIEGMGYGLKANTFPITAPHFVQWIIQEAEKTIDKDTLAKGGFTIKTTLDLEMQKLAEEAITSNVAVLQENGANNSSMVYLDSLNGDVLAYVGSINYFDEQIKGQNDMVQRPRQSGSSIKPLIYALALEKLGLSIDSPIYDIPFKIGPDKPNNADDKFEGVIPLKFALGHSRNIPSAKIALALGGEEAIKPFLQDLGLSGVKDNVQYGYTIALGAAEITMLDLANGYMHLSAQGKPAKIDPILEIKGRDGTLIYQKKVVMQKEIVKPGVAYLLWKILADPANRIPGWIGKFNVSGLTYALKSGTSNAKTDRGNRPRDGWLVAYTPSKVAMFRAGNADGTPMNVNAYGGTIHANPIKKFLGGLVKNNYIANETMKSVDTSSVQISKISGKLATADTPSEFVVSSIAYAGGPGFAEDAGASKIQYDSACGGMPSSLTPPQELKDGYLITPTTFMPDNMDLQEITDWYKIGSTLTGQKKDGTPNNVSGNVTYTYRNVFVEAPSQACADRELKEDPNINVQITQPNGGDVGKNFSLSFNAQGPKNIRKVSVLIDDVFVTSFSYVGQTKNISKTENVQLGTGIKDGEHTLKVIVFDFAGYSNKDETSITIVKKTDTQPPVLLEDEIKVVKQGSGTYQVTLKFSDDSGVENGKIVNNGTTLKEFEGATVTFITETLVPVSITVADTNGNKLEKSVDLSTYIQQ